MPKYRLPDDGALPDVVERLIHDELMLDGNARLNLATFVTTWMDPQAERLMAEAFDKNMIDKDEYPATAEIEKRCVNIVADLFNAPVEGDAIGVSTTGSSEAVMLGGLALKWRWRQRREAAGQDGSKPNLVLGSRTCRWCGRRSPLLGRGAALRAGGEGPLVITPRRGRGGRRREHHRCRRHPGYHLRRRVRATQGDPRRGRGQQRGQRPAGPAPHRRCLSRSWRLSSIRTSNGTSDCPTWYPSMPPATSTAWSTRASGSSSGATSSTCPRSSSSESTTSVATCPRSRSTSAALATRSSASTTTSSAWGGRVTPESCARSRAWPCS